MAEEHAPRSRRELLAPLVVGAVLVYAVLFVFLNTRHVRVSFVIASTRVSLIWVILLSLAAGTVLGALVPRLYRRRQRRG